jgi:O-antigen/teichoic acid export membrane protein
MMVLSALARPFIIVLLTEKWEASIILLQLMCFSFMWYPIHAINLNLLNVKGRTDYFFKLEIIKKSCGLIALAISLPIGLIAVVLSNWVTNILSLAVNTYCTKKIINYGLIEQIKDLLPTLLLSLFIWSVINIVNLFVDSYLFQIITGFTIGLITYFGIASLFHFSELEDLKYMIKRK